MCFNKYICSRIYKYKVIDRIYTSRDLSSSISFPFERIFANSAAHAFSADDLYTNRENRILWVLPCRGISVWQLLRSEFVKIRFRAGRMRFDSIARSSIPKVRYNEFTVIISIADFDKSIFFYISLRLLSQS